MTTLGRVERHARGLTGRLHRALQRPHAQVWRALLEAACRAGFAARGFIYLNVGLLALLSALGFSPKASSAVEAFEAWATWPLGIVLLWLTGLGLYGFAAWRALQSLFDADGQGVRWKAIASRIGQAVSGLVYGGLAISVFGVIDALEDLREVDDQADTRVAIQAVMDMPQGPLLVSAAGLFIMACGVGNIVQAFFRDFCAHLACSRPLARKAALLGRVGYAARGIVFLPAGAFMLLAGLHARSGEVKNTGAALDWLKSQPFGDMLLAFTALGLIAFGAFAFVEARFRTLGVVTAAATPGPEPSPACA